MDKTPNQIREIRDTEESTRETTVDYKKTVEKYIKNTDWRVKENSTVTYSVGGLILSNSGMVTANYWLSEIYDKEIADAHSGGDIHIHDLSMLTGYCFTGDTRVKTLDGKNHSFKELVDNGVKDLWVYAYDHENKQIVPALATNPRITRTTEELAEITMCDGTVIRCTPDHLFMLRDGGYIPASDIKANMSLMPLYVSEGSSYCSVHKAWSSENKKMYVHRWVAEQMLGRALRKDEVVHHKNGDKHDNRPENLEVMQSSEHRSKELKRTMKTELWKLSNAKRVSEYNKSSIKRAMVSAAANSRERDERGRFMSRFAYVPANDAAEAAYNHRVRKVRVVKLDSPISVYDLTVPKYENFAVEGNVFVHNCAGWSLRQLIEDGLGGVPGKISSAPAKHLATLCNQMVNFLGIMQNEWAGAQAFSSFDTYLAPFVRTDNLDYDATKKCIESFVYGVNTPSRWGTQAPFSNITLDWTVPDDLAELNCIVGGKEMDFKYKDVQREMDMVNKAFIEVMIEGDANGRGFQYPIPSYSITKDFDWSETENNRLLFEMASKYGTPYFSNYVNSDMEPSDVRSMAILGTQNVIYRDKFGRISKNEIRHLVNNWLENPDRGYQMLMNGKFVDVVDMFKVDDKNYPTYVRISLANGQNQSFSYDHKCIVLRDGTKAEVLSQDVLNTDKFLLAKHGYDNDGIGTYDAGKILGYYLAEGWIAHGGAQIEFAININRGDIVSEIKRFFETLGSCVSVDEQTESSIFHIKVYGRGAASLMTDFVDGKNAKGKRLRVTVFNTSLDFRKGICDGYMQTDGSPENRIFAHTTNKELCDDPIELGASIGRYFRYHVNPKNTRYFKADKSDLTTFTSYKLIPITLPEVTIDGEDYYVVDVTGIEQIDASRTNTVYNFTVNTKDHLYELPNGIITHQCCRLRLDLRELRKKTGGFFGSGESTGSIGVVTINMPRIAYLSETPEEFYERLDKLMDISARSLKIKREFITKMMDDGLYPYTKRYLGTFENHFSTIGLVGMNEAGLNAKWIRKNMSDPETQKFSIDVLNHMRERLSDYQELYGDLYNLEATPAESTAYRLAKHDKEKYPDIITASEMSGGAPYYTNSSHLPVGYTEDVFSALDVQDELQTLYTSGTVFHAFLGEKLPTWKSAAELVRKIAENYRLPYYTLSPTYSVCKNHGYIAGEHAICPRCGERTEVNSRITGYYRPVQNWNDGKAQEFRDRVTYDIGSSRLTHSGPAHTDRATSNQYAERIG